MDAVSSYFSANPAAFTLLTIFIVVMILFFILKKLIKLAIVVVFVILLAGGVYLFKDPASMPDKIREAVETLQAGGEQIGEKFGYFVDDTKNLAGKVSKAPGEINKMLDTADKDIEKEYKKK